MNELILRLMASLSTWQRKERGQGTAEYVLISAAVVAVVAAVVYGVLSTALTNAVTNLGTKITSAVGSIGS